MDTTLLLSVWAARNEEATRRGKAGDGSRRACGELRIPLGRLLQQCHAMLYQTWAVLDFSGLTDSVASVGLSDDASTLDQSLVLGPRQLHQPRICLSVCRTGDLGPNGRLLLSQEATPDVRVERWAALLRSQQQHAALSGALYNGGAKEKISQSSEQKAREERMREKISQSSE